MSLPPGAVWLDAQGAQNRQHFDRGIPRYVRDHAAAVVMAAPDAIAAVGLNPDLPLTANFQPFVGSGILQWDDRRPAHCPRIFHVMSPYELQLPLDVIWPQWARSPGTQTAVTLYDLIPLVFSDHYLRDPALRARYEARTAFVRSVDRIFAISQTTADDAERLLGVPADRITVVDAGAAEHFATSFVDPGEARRLADRRFPGIRPGFMLYVAGVEFRKNIDRLVEAHGRTSEAFRDRHQLVITCRMRPEDEAHVRGVAERSGCRPGDLVLTNYVTDTELAALYATCGLFVFASFYEGSGLPILEAMSCGAPVAASRTSTSPEILGDLEATFDPFDVDDIARVLEATLGDEALLGRLRDRSRRRVRDYSWARTAEATLAGYERMLQPGSGRRRRARPRIALHTPWPPERSGIAAYNRRLVAELRRHVDVDVVVSGAPAEYEAGDGVRLVQDAGDTGADGLRPHDRAVYCLGNSHFHHDIYAALLRRPGVVVCHDVRLAGLFGSYAAVEHPEDPPLRLAHRYEGQYGTRLGLDLRAHIPSPWEQSDLGVYLTAEMQEHAEKVLVHSDYAVDLLRLDAMPGVPAPAAVVPFAFPEVRPEVTRPLGADDGTIVSFGIVSPVKMPDALIEAMAYVRRHRPRARLVFAGGASEDELQRLRDVADRAGVDDGVEVLGHVDDDAYGALLDGAHVAVQLRLIQNGEASAAIADTMAAGLPTVVTDEGWVRELPDESVVKVAPQLSVPMLADALLGVLEDRDRAARISRAARAHAASSGVEVVARAYLEALDLSG